MGCGQARGGGVAAFVGDFYGGTDFGDFVQAGGEVFGHADAAMGSGFAGFGDVADVHADAVRGEALPIGHGGGHVFLAFADARRGGGVAVDDIAGGILDPAVFVGVFVNDLFDDAVGTGGGAAAFLAGGDVAPADGASAAVDVGFLVGKVDFHADFARAAVIVPLGEHVAGPGRR